MRKTRLCSGFLLTVFFLSLCQTSLSSSYSDSLSSQTASDQDWYYLSAFPDYAPAGLPDFDQQQDNWKARQGIWRFIGGLWSFCGPTALADIFWWFDSKHETSTGHPGDGVDTYPLVRDYQAPGVPIPGPYSDDHNFNNVNDNQTSWKQGKGGKELIETIAWYCNTNFCRYPLIRGFAGTYTKYLEAGANQWLADAGLQNQYTVTAVWKPDFSLILNAVHNNSGVIINLLFYNPNALLFRTFLGHYVAVAGVNPTGFIALSDPFQNVANPTPAPWNHNDAAVVSYDLYPINVTSPFPEKASWWISEYFHIGTKTFGGIAHYALIIAEKP
jgi:hypothetical protein